MLYLRRRAGERILVHTPEVEAWIEVQEIDVDAGTARIAITGLNEPVELRERTSVKFLQGEGEALLSTIQEMDGEGENYVSIGIGVPRHFMINREELVKGMDRGRRAKMVRYA